MSFRRHITNLRVLDLPLESITDTLSECKGWDWDRVKGVNNPFLLSLSVQFVSLLPIHSDIFRQSYRTVRHYQVIYNQ